jgi:tetratricopeptide (TPR) repeat protein
MSELRIENWKIQAADLGNENPLPPLFPERKAPQFQVDSNIPQEIVEKMGYGHVPSVLPYSMQDGYKRDQHSADFRVAVLENDILKATFLLEYGGRLWSLYHKPANRELLEVNPVFQLANLAIRNAWFSGGVEWNVGTLGHSPFTCSPLFASRLEREDGTPVLRLYEWERFRQVPFQIDAYLPESSPVLFLHVRIQNPNRHEVPMYWWTNIAVPEQADVRVITPSDSAYCLGCKPGWLARISIPVHEDTDYTYSGEVTHAGDFFFHIPEGQLPWIAAVDGDGRGLLHVSTQEMFGRKLWVWGKGVGGKNWQKFLSPPGKGYIEIQAGLTRTQLEHLPLPPGGELSWVEAMGMVEADPDVVHRQDWQAARHGIELAFSNLISQDELESEHEKSVGFCDKTPTELIQRGSGWGALERRRREVKGEPPACSAGLIFDDDSLDSPQQPWVELLEHGAMGIPATDHAPDGFMIEENWRLMLEDSMANPSADHWFSQFHLGVMQYTNGDFTGAKEAWARSIEHSRTPWALRNLAVLYWKEKQFEKAVDMFPEACQLATALLPLAVECGNCLIDAGQPGKWLEFLGSFPDFIRSTGRIRLLEAQAALAVINLEVVKKFFDDAVTVEDLREGENTLSDLWFSYHEQYLSKTQNIPIDVPLKEKVRRQYPLPESIDFRMS